MATKERLADRRRLHRLSLLEHARTPAEAFSGRGGLVGKGRWHTRGRLIVYTSSHLSLALAEVLVHLSRATGLQPFCRWEIEVPEALLEPPPALPDGWQEDLAYTQALGDAWLRSGQRPAWRVPSALVEGEENVLLNPAHADFDLRWVSQAGPRAFRFDARLVKG